ARSEITRGTAALVAAADDLRANGVAAAAITDLETASARLASAENRASWASGLGAAVVITATTVLAVLAPVLSPQLPAEHASVIALLALGLLEPLTALVSAVQRVPAMRAILRRLALVLRPAPQPGWGSDAPSSVVE